MKTMNLSEAVERWAPVLDFADAPVIKDRWKRKVVAQLLENQQANMAQSEQALQALQEAAPTNNISGGNISTWDPILISLVRRAMPNLIAYDVCGVQPMNGPTGLIFALRSRYTNQTGTEALFNEADTSFSGQNSGASFSTNTHSGTDPVGTGFDGTAGAMTGALATGWATGHGMTTAQAEALGDGSTGTNNFAEMAFSIEKVTVTAVSRALKAEYTIEIAQDLKAVHGLDAESELANILSAEILTEINREVIRNIYFIAKAGCQNGTTTRGVFDLDVDSNGRWSVEKFKGLLFQIEREANQIAKQTRRGRGNIAIVSSDVASALSLAGVLDYAPAMSTNLDVDDTGNTFCGVLGGKIRVYIDPYYLSSGTDELAVVGYRGTHPYDAGFFYCPYVPLQMVRAVDPQSFQPKIGFKTRYGKVENPFYAATNAAVRANNNPFYRIFKVTNLL